MRRGLKVTLSVMGVLLLLVVLALAVLIGIVSLGFGKSGFGSGVSVASHLARGAADEPAG